MFVVGSALCEGKCNKGEITTDGINWTRAGDFTYQSIIYGNSLVFYDKHYYTFGGNGEDSLGAFIRQVGRLAENNGLIGSWSLAGSMNTGKDILITLIFQISSFMRVAYI